MKKPIKIILYALASILVLLVLALLFIQIRGIPNYGVHMTDKIRNLKVEITPERLIRGKEIASIRCSNCHRGSDGKLSGGQMKDVPAEFGVVYAKNITQHPTKGIGNWSDGELYYLLRTSINRDGDYVPPYMPALPKAADEDLYSIIAWLRSDAPAVQPSEKVQPLNKPTFLVKFLSNVAFKPFPLPDKEIQIPDKSQIKEYGAYVANVIADCYSCHSADFKTNNTLEPEKSTGFYGGGNPLLDLDGNVTPSPNITFHPESGIGKRYSKEQFIEVVKYGKKPDGTMVMYPMIPFSAMSDEDVGIIYEYLRTVPKLGNSE